MTPRLGFSDLLDWLTELRNILYLHFLIYYKGYYEGCECTARCRRIEDEVCRGLKHRSWGAPPHHGDTFTSLLFGGLWRFQYVCTIDEIICRWWLNSVSSPSPVAGGWRVPNF